MLEGPIEPRGDWVSCGETPGGRIQEMKRQKEKKKEELTAHRESLRRDTNRGVRSQPDMQCTRRPLSSETTHNGTFNTALFRG